MAQREGILTLLDHGIALGNTNDRHVVLTRADLQFQTPDAPEITIPWQSLESVGLDASSTRWPHPWVGDIVMPVVLGIVALLDFEPATKELSLSGRSAGQPFVWSLSPHYSVGYRKRHVAEATSLLHLLHSDSTTRALLDTPDRLVRMVRQR